MNDLYFHHSLSESEHWTDEGCAWCVWYSPHSARLQLFFWSLFLFFLCRWCRGGAPYSLLGQWNRVPQSILHRSTYTKGSLNLNVWKQRYSLTEFYGFYGFFYGIWWILWMVQCEDLCFILYVHCSIDVNIKGNSIFPNPVTMLGYIICPRLWPRCSPQPEERWAGPVNGTSQSFAIFIKAPTKTFSLLKALLHYAKRAI